MPRTVPFTVSWLLTALLLAPAFASDAGLSQQPSLGLSPGTVEHHNALAGETYHSELRVQNRLEEPIRLEAEHQGTVGSWATLGPVGPYELDSGEDQELELKIKVPEGTPDGQYEGEIHFIASSTAPSQDDGYEVQHSVGVLLELFVGGEPEPSVQYLDVKADDVEIGDPAQVRIEVANTGNTRMSLTLSSFIYAMGDPARLDQTTVAVDLDPGETQWVEMEHAAPLSNLGNHLARAGPSDGSHPLEAPFKVVPVGELGKDLTLRELRHTARAQIGETVRIEAPIVNTGDVTIGRARLMGEITRDGKLEGIFESEPRSLTVGQELLLRSHFTPDKPGRHVLVATVVYDGFETNPSESMLTVEAPAATHGFFLPLLFLLALGLFIIIFVLMRRARGEVGQTSGDNKTPTQVRGTRTGNRSHSADRRGIRGGPRPHPHATRTYHKPRKR